MRFFYLGFLLLVGCAPQPSLVMPVIRDVPAKVTTCDSIYPKGKWQFVHKISFTMPDGKNGMAIGISVIDEPTIKAALMTVEGLTLFEAIFDGKLKITRALPPFDRPGFGMGLIHDLQLIFFKPPGHKVEYGKLANGTFLCRYQSAMGEYTDIIPNGVQGWQIMQYNRDQRRIRMVQAYPEIITDNNSGWCPPKKLKLKADGLSGYSLTMDLISAKKLATQKRENEKTK